MSGIEFAGLAIGIIPIIAEILKSYSATRSRLKTFARYTHIISDVQLRYQVAAANFSNSCQLLLQAAIDDLEEVSEMIKNPDHSGWRQSSLEDRFRNFLDRDYQLCQAIVVKVRDVLRETGKTIMSLDQNDNIALFQAFNIASKENRYRKALEELDQWNLKLSNICEQRCKLRKRRSAFSNCIVRKPAPKKFLHIRAASQTFRESLQESWSCTNVSHTGHQAKLSLDAITEYETVQLDVVIACQRRVAVASSR
jgi:hypothetical protein